ncbi:MAG: hypothetical protein F4162_03950 [Synechococcus sp. SB0676_bin_10]|uniref:Transposase DDE domain-containing protein n=1 Tax=Synechococcus sp. SB0676_bin_10 TaxID=2604869 RepID=A0A6B1FCY4_9SYNE|nr:hypothetical protein [Cyanobacteria bacterium MAG IRC3_bin_20]MDE0648358.1 hypothetical protein [Cyanobacteria bacterium MAG IRC4_bin_6]MXY19005.1 hypothetical protein [Synechococcus sp. SB0664_bin_36]MYG38152.1 hypothetical protein [Synechococcus sp. SB0676_bin_10]MYK06974.1 hypothetical protein [Synechococcus sp. SB0670_bin_20]
MGIHLYHTNGSPLLPEATIILFYCLDDSATLFEQWERHHLLPSGRQRNRAGQLSLGEMLFILVLFPISAYKDFKHCWHYGLRHEYRTCFAELPIYGRFVSLPPRLLLPLYLLLHSFRDQKTGISTLPRAQTGPLPYVRISRNRVFRGLAKRGCSTMGWFFGFKLHLRINHKGQLTAFKVTAGNTDARQPFEALAAALRGKCLRIRPICPRRCCCASGGKAYT